MSWEAFRLTSKSPSELMNVMGPNGIDALVPLPEDRLLYEDISGLAAKGLSGWTEHRYLRTVEAPVRLAAMRIS